VVDFLAGLAGTGPVLELGIGTGRMALPLSRRDVRVHGIELSPAMVARLQAQDAEAIGITILSGRVPGADYPVGAVPHAYWVNSAVSASLDSPEPSVFAVHRLVCPRPFWFCLLKRSLVLSGDHTGLTET
jgi:SAM-dependent methyltransferase